ncbi:putative aminotransferase [Aspergillus carlsbadensis]|nr:putative aminotransferase [Aspergillus carlsbadensis]
MVHIKEFAVEQWMDQHETWAKHNLAETCCASVSLESLAALSGDSPATALGQMLDTSQAQIYGDIRGSPALRSRIAALYDSEAGGVSPDHVLVANGAIQSNFLALYTQVGPGDHVIVHYPTYQQLYSVPESLGAEVSLWKAKEGVEGGWRVDVEELERLVRPNTKMIVLNNPQNPTGAVLPHETLQAIVCIARKHDLTIHSDEVYRPLFHSLPNGTKPPPSILDFDYEKAVAVGSLSKAYSLAGIRVGWIASRSREIIESCASARDYTTISVGRINDRIATFALSEPTAGNLLVRNIELGRRNLVLLGEFVDEFADVVQWVKPRGGTTAFLRFTRGGKAVDDVELCGRLQSSVGVMFVPGSRCFGEDGDFRGYVRVGFVPEHEVMVEGLKALREFMRSEYQDVPVSV